MKTKSSAIGIQSNLDCVKKMESRKRTEPGCCRRTGKWSMRVETTMQPMEIPNRKSCLGIRKLPHAKVRIFSMFLPLELLFVVSMTGPIDSLSHTLRSVNL